MTDRRIRSLCRWMSDLANDFGLSDKKINVHVGGPGEAEDGSDAIASVAGIYGRNILNVSISPAFFDQSPEEQRYIVIHEYAHAHTEAVRDLLRTALPKLLGQPAYDTFQTAYTQLDELATDSLARAIAPMFPLWEGA